MKHVNTGDWVEGILGGTRSGDGNEYICDCPECGKVGHFYFNVEKGVGHCFVCGYSPNVLTLLRDVEGLSLTAAYSRYEQFKTGLWRARVSSVEKAGEHLFNLLTQLMGRVRLSTTGAESVLRLPRSIGINDAKAKRAREYLHRRGFTEAHWKPYGLRYCFARDADVSLARYFKHLIFPEYDQRGTLRFFTSRLAGEPTQKGAPKTYHPAGVQKQGLLYGVNALKNAEVVYVVEGPLDVLALSGHAVALLGSTASVEQVRALLALQRRIVIALDSDAYTKAMSLYSRLIQLSDSDVDVSIAQLVDGDPGDYAQAGIDPERACKMLLQMAKKISLRSRIFQTLC